MSGDQKEFKKVLEEKINEKRPLDTSKIPIGVALDSDGQTGSTII